MSVVQVLDKELEVDWHTVLLIDQDPNIHVLAKAKGREYRMSVDSASNAAAGLALIDRKAAEGKFYHHMIFAMRVIGGNWPSWFTEQYGNYQGESAVMRIIPAVRWRYQMDPLVYILTGEDPYLNPNLEKNSLATDICYVWSKSLEFKEVYENILNVEKELSEEESDSGLHIGVYGVNYAGKTNLNSRLRTSRRVRPQPIRTGARHYQGPMSITKVSDNPHSKPSKRTVQGDLPLTDTHEDTRYVPNLKDVADDLEELDEGHHVILWRSREASEYLYVIPMTDEGAAGMYEIGQRLGHDLSNINYAQMWQRLGKNYTTITANPEAALKIDKYIRDFGGESLAVKCNINQQTLLQRMESRDGFSPKTQKTIGSDVFKRADERTREEMLLAIQQEEAEKPLHYQGQLTDIGVKVRDIYQRMDVWDHTRFENEFILHAEQMYRELPRLEQRISEENVKENKKKKQQRENQAT